MNDLWGRWGWEIIVAFLGMTLHVASAKEQALAPLQAASDRLRRFTLDNGMICLILEDHSAPVVAIQYWVGTGAIHEERFLGAGMSHFVEHMIFKGTPTYKPGEITKAINDAGGKINAYTAMDRTVFHTDLPSKNWLLGLNILSDAIQHPLFPEEECRREQEVILREMAMCQDDPDRVHNQLLWSTAYAVHPFRIPIIGYPDVFKTMTRADLKEFFDLHYGPDSMVLVVVGDIDPQKVEAEIRRLNTGFLRRARAPVIVPQEPPQISPRSARQTGSYQIGRLHIAYHTVALTHPDAPALDLLATIVGQGRSSRLNVTIKEKLRLVHSIEGWSFTPGEPGLFGISAIFDPGRDQEVLGAIEKEIAEWIDHPVSRAELDKARKLFLAGELMSLQNMNGQAGKFATGEFYAHNPGFSIGYLRQIETVTPQDLQRVAARYFQPQNRTVAWLVPETTNAPASTPAAIGLNSVQKLILKQGTPLLVREDHRIPLVYVCAAFRGGLLAEKESLCGISRLMSELLIRGTPHHSAEALAMEIESMGANLIPFAGQNSFGIQGHCLKEDAPRLLSLMAECLAQPTFPEEEIGKQKKIQAAALAEQNEQPFVVAQQTLLGMLFPDHPYRWNPLGTTDSIARISRADLAAFHKQMVGSRNMALAVFGSATPDEARAMAEKAFDEIPAGTPVQWAQKGAAKAAVLPALTEQREPKQQTIILLGTPSVDLRDPRCDALHILETAMSGLSGGLAHEIREKRGLAYYMGASFRPGIDPGLFMLYAGTRDDVLTEVQGLMTNELNRMIVEGPTQEEIDRARKQIIASWEMGLQDNLGLATSCALNELYGLGFDYNFSLPHRMNTLTRENVRHAFATIADPRRLAISIVRPAESPASSPPK